MMSGFLRSRMERTAARPRVTSASVAPCRRPSITKRSIGSPWWRSKETIAKDNSWRCSNVGAADFLPLGEAADGRAPQQNASAMRPTAEKQAATRARVPILASDQPRVAQRCRAHGQQLLPTSARACVARPYPLGGGVNADGDPALADEKRTLTKERGGEEGGRTILHVHDCSPR